MSSHTSSSVSSNECFSANHTQFSQAGTIDRWCTNPSHKIYRAKQALYAEGDQFRGLFQLRSGAAKSVIHSAQGDELITEFLFPGNIIGIDGFNLSHYNQTVSFLETSSVLFLDGKEVKRLLAKSESFRQSLLHSLSQKVILEQHLLLEFNACTSEQRLAKFFLNMSASFRQQGCSENAFRLPMSRTDIASYLGMALETLSRLLSQLQQQEILSVDKRMIEIKNMLALSNKAAIHLNQTGKYSYQ